MYKMRSLKEVALDISRNDLRSVAYLYHATIVAARALGIYDRGRQYSMEEGNAIWRQIDKLFPARGTD